jgi:hypothetical protein
MRDKRQVLARAGVCLTCSIFFLLTGTARLEADHNRLLQREFRRAISRHVAFDSQGHCYLVLPSPASVGGQGFTLKVSQKPHPESISDFPVTVSLPTLQDTPGASLSSVGLAVDPQDRLHVIYTTERGLTAYSVIETQALRSDKAVAKWLDPVSGQAGGLIIAKNRSWAGDICRSPDGQVWLTWTTDGGDDSEVTVHLGTFRDGAWQSYELGRGNGLYPPAMLFSQDGVFVHVASGDTKGGTHYLKQRVSKLNTGPWQFQWSHAGNRPALAETTGEVLAVHESGDSLKYTFLERRPRPSHPLTDLDVRFAWDTVHSPRMVVDRYRVPWLFFIDSTRQHVFYSRWLGTRWSPIMNGFWLTRNTARHEDNHLSIDWLGLEHGAGADKSSIALVIGHRSRFPATLFHVLRVPSLKSDPGNRVLFLDLKEIQHIDGIALKVDTARKFSGNPVIAAGRPGEFDSQGASKVKVLKQQGVYRAWYSGMYREPGSEWPKSGSIPSVRVGYAESGDGRSFKKKPLGLASFGDNDNTNMVAGLPATPIYRPVVPSGMYVDSHDPEPMRRYKFLTWTSTAPSPNRAGLIVGQSDDAQTWTLWTSPDGLRWHQASRGGIRFPAGMPASFSPQALFHDPDERDPARKYKAYGFMGLNNDRRGGGYGFSADASEWTADPRNPIFDPWARAIPVVRNGKVEQIHDVVVWKYRQYYLALYQYQRSGTKMTVELAMSRDGEHFTYIQPGSEVVRRGAAGEWDSDEIGPSVPLVDAEDIKVYYTGYRFSKTRLIEGEHSCGLATLRLDGFTHLTLEDGQDQGSITTIPVDRGSASDLYVNASCGKGSRLEVELIDPESGDVVPGYSREECTPLETDSLAHRVVWGNLRFGDAMQAPVQLRFHFTNGRTSPNLYSFEFRRASNE